MEGRIESGEAKSELSVEKLEILNHTAHRAANGRYCGDSLDMQRLVTLGLMKSAGRVSFVPDEYFKLTNKGRQAVSTPGH